MSQKGIENAYALLGGTQGWKSAGYPMEGNGPAPGTPVVNPTPAAPQAPSASPVKPPKATSTKPVGGPPNPTNNPVDTPQPR